MYFRVDPEARQISMTIPDFNATVLERGAGDGLFEGCMKLGVDQLNRLKAAMLDTGALEGVAAFGQPAENAIIADKYRWPKGVLKYQLDSRLSTKEKSLVRTTLRNLQTKLTSCIRFVESSSGNRINVINNGGGCWSYIGYQSQALQDLSLQSGGCMSAGIIEHEFLHALGIFHHQSRSDRDRYVRILWQNIPENRKRNFHKYDSTVINHYGLPYDFTSVMHYGSTAFGIGGRTTIQTLDPSKQRKIGQRGGVSAGDIELLRRHYNCPAAGGR